ncbi:right-handed parallel beta-helix repeat-containing protein [Candidatus Electronema sp. PJ]|uniref:right-handed parallel beta-helix repeat-containing protein n=1 Tax=Candidatus Electronema sp. PJ TaxID=3401572 RepID=UPI003AA7C13F
MSRVPKAFMSYVNLDDQHENGLITQFREHLSRAVRMQTGEAFEIFQDRKDIAWGQQWQERINHSLDATTFLLPIITPAFFKSNACREELKRFLKREEELQRGDLILPVYYVNCPVLSDKAKREHDKLAQIIAARQYADWRELRFEPFTTPQVRRTFAKLAEQIAAALERSEDKSSSSTAARPADAVKEILASKQTEKESAGRVSHSNTFQSDGGTQSVAQGKGAIGTQINYGVPVETFKQLLQEAQLLKEQLKENKLPLEPVAKTEPPTVFVDAMHRGDYVTITEALKAVKPGTRILVRPGLYKEGIVIDKPVEIIGTGERNDIVIEASGKATVLFKANMGRLANLTLRQAVGGKYFAVDISQGRLDLEDCDISSQGWACVLIHSGADPRLRRNRIYDGKSCGIGVYENGQGTLEDNEIFTNGFAGVMIETGGKPTLRQNRIFQNVVGIWGRESGNGIFEDNDLRDNAKGAWFIEPGCEARVQRRGNLE